MVRSQSLIFKNRGKGRVKYMWQNIIIIGSRFHYNVHSEWFTTALFCFVLFSFWVCLIAFTIKRLNIYF